MKKIRTNNFIFILIISCFFTGCSSSNKEIQPAYDVLVRALGQNNASRFELILDKKVSGNDAYTIEVKDNKVYITGNSPVALCSGAYRYLKSACNGIVSWSGNRIHIPDTLPVYSERVQSPYSYRYYLCNTAHGYTMPFWDWERWEKEIDWMALHGINMPMLSGAHEAILYRVFKNIGLTDDEIKRYFSGPAYFPWNRMGNLTGWCGDFPESFYEKQVALNHQIINRLKELKMHPIIPAFAGFVPKEIKRIYPGEKLRDLEWGGGLDTAYRAHILDPGSKLFVEIGKMYVTEWEKEFGKAELYLADSFNEMEVPISEDPVVAAKELAGYGEQVYRSIHEANPDAKWVMQGWTFPFHKDKNGDLFWTPDRLNALVSLVPDDKLIILDLANEYNKLRWNIEPSWKIYDGFFGKGWIYSFIPNMGGKVPLNGRLDLYATMAYEALQYENKKNLVGFGIAPEGIENNEIVYELLSDVIWTTKPIDLNVWIPQYCTQRYGAYPEKMKEAFSYLNKSSYGSFVPHPRHRYQLHPSIDFNSLVPDFQNEVHSSEDFKKGVELFLNAAVDIKNAPLYTYDVIELVVQYSGLIVDLLLEEFKDQPDKNKAKLDEAIELMAYLDRLLATHPNHSLKRWVDFARNFGDNDEESMYYEANAKRLLTTWGKGLTVLDDYAARTWTGMVGDYYLMRWKLYYNTPKAIREQVLLDWQENWIQTPYVSDSKPFENPLEAANKIFNKYKNVTLKSIPNEQK
jgi:alpha-N-acetylglucosaminidase